MHADLRRLYLDLRRTFPMLPAQLALKIARQSLAVIARLERRHKGA